MSQRVVRFALIVVACVLAPARAHAQMRPLNPVMFRAFDGRSNLRITLGVSSLSDQRASSAGTIGTLQELGLYSITWRTGRVALTGSGTAYLRMRDETPVEAALPGVGSSHRDAGPVILETAARLSPDNAPLLWLLRFGTQLPVTSRVSGLERDEADVFATLGLRSNGDVWIAGEAGAAINGKPEPFAGQNDVVMYSMGVGYRGHALPVGPEVWIVGHDDLHPNRARGNEDLVELRVAVRTRGPVWISGEWIHGLADFSPGNGLRITGGVDAHFDRVPLLGWH